MTKIRYSNLQVRVWRWHFVAGLMVLPFAVLLAISGAVYVFKPQITHLKESEIANNAPAVKAGAVVMSADALLNGLHKLYPGAVFKRFTLAKENDRSVEIELDHSGNKRIYRVDKYTGNVLFSQDKNTQFLHLIKKLHGELLGGNAGSYLVELMACWMIVLIITGIYLWLPRHETSFFKALRTTLVPELGNSSKRRFWQRLHGAVGLWVSLVVLTLLVSGLPWTQVWGGGFKQVQKLMAWNDPGQKSMITLKSGENSIAKGSEKVDVDIGSELWALRSDEEYSVDLESKPGTFPARQFTLSQVVANAQALQWPDPVEITPPKSGRGVWTVRSMTQDRPRRATVHYDLWSGEEIMRINFSDYHPVKKITSYGIAFHEGALFGPLNQLLCLLAAIGVIFVAVSGGMMWWKRRPSGQLGIPKLPVDFRLGRGVIAIVVLLATLLPMVAISLIIVLSAEYIWSLVVSDKKVIKY